MNYTAVVNKTEALTIWIVDVLGTRLSEIANKMRLTRADYVRMVLRFASKVDFNALRQAWEVGLQNQLLQR